MEDLAISVLRTIREITQRMLTLELPPEFLGKRVETVISDAEETAPGSKILKYSHINALG